MTATSKITTTHLPAISGQTSTFVQMVKTVFTSIMRRWTFSNGRRQVLNLSSFDDHMLRDIGLRLRIFTRQLIIAARKTLRGF